MTRLRDLDLQEHLDDPSRKQQFVTPMFDLIAPRYDDFTRVFSFGMDRVWKRALIGDVAAWAARTKAGQPVVLDVACGTGDLAFGVRAAVPDASIRGVDASSRMIAFARARATRDDTPEVRFDVADLTALGDTDASIDVVTAGYAFRNVPDARRAVTGMARLLRRGGVLVTLDFYRPASRTWRWLFLRYLRAAGNIVGWLWHREPVAYGYIAPSIDGYLTVAEFSAVLRDAGFHVQHERSYLGGGVALHLAERL